LEPASVGSGKEDWLGGVLRGLTSADLWPNNNQGLSKGTFNDKERGVDRQAAILLNAIILMVMVSAAAVAGQGTREKDARDKAVTSEATGSSPSQKRPILLNAPRVSTERAAREAAAKGAAPKPEPASDASAAEADAVVELQPTAAGTPSPGNVATATPEGLKKSKRRSIHGSIHGSADPTDSGTHQAGGSVGASSKSGKVHIYVEGERAGRTSPAPR